MSGSLDLSWVEFESRGVTGMGRLRTLDYQGNVVEGPKPWRQSPGELVFWLFLWAAAAFAASTFLALMWVLVGGSWC